jgi:hypothetical protein
VCDLKVILAALAPYGNPKPFFATSHLPASVQAWPALLYISVCGSNGSYAAAH